MRTINYIPLLLLVGILSGCTTQAIQPEPVKPVQSKPAPQKKPDEKPLYIKIEKGLLNDDLVRVGRYSVVEPDAEPGQTDLLDIIVQTKIPHNAKTVKDGLNFLLSRSGYSLASQRDQGKDVAQLFSQRIPAAHRTLGPLPLKKALLLLVGDAFWMKVDPVHRLIAFDTVDEYK